MKKSEILTLFFLALELQEKGDGINGFPYISVWISNYSRTVDIYIIDNGFKPGGNYDGHYSFSFDGEVDGEYYNQCVNHLLMLQEKAKNIELEKAGCEKKEVHYHVQIQKWNNPEK